MTSEQLLGVIFNTLPMQTQTKGGCIMKIVQWEKLNLIRIFMWVVLQLRTTGNKASNKISKFHINRYSHSHFYSQLYSYMYVCK
jgi:hypothetical protein